MKNISPDDKSLPMKELELVNQFKERKKQPLIMFKGEDNKISGIEVIASSGVEGKDILSLSMMMAATGSVVPDFQSQLLQDCALASGIDEKSPNYIANLNSAFGALQMMCPKDEIEGMLVSQLVALHHQIMSFMKRSISPGQSSEGVDLNVNRVTKLTRLFNETLETLMKYRRKGEQKVVVQHVSVSNGGQAVVGGHIQTGRGGI